MKRTIKKLLALFCAWMMAGALSVSACAATIDGTAKLTITPTEPKVSGDMATVTYELTVTPPEGKELGVFSIQLQPSEGMELAENFSSGNERTITYGDGKLKYDEVSKTGIFAIYAYTPQTGYFAAVGTTPERRMSQEAKVLTIQATMPADKAGTYTLNAEFIAALDGSGDVYTAQVSTTPVTVSAGKAPVADNTPQITETNGETLPNRDNSSSSAASGEGAAAGMAGGDGTASGTVGNGGAAANGTGGTNGTNGMNNAATGGITAPAEEVSSGSALPWIIGGAAVVIIALAVVLVLRRKK